MNNLHLQIHQAQVDLFQSQTQEAIRLHQEAMELHQRSHDAMVEAHNTLLRNVSAKSAFDAELDRVNASIEKTRAEIRAEATKFEYVAKQFKDRVTAALEKYSLDRV